MTREAELLWKFASGKGLDAQERAELGALLKQLQDKIKATSNGQTQGKTP